MNATALPQQQHEAECQVGCDDFARRSLHPSEIRAAQRKRGEEPCFSTDKRYGCAERCEWRKDCLKPRAVWL